MSGAALETLLKLRQSELDDAKRHLARLVSLEIEASEAVGRAEACLLDEQRRAMDSDGEDDAVEDFARWLPAGRAAIQDARRREQSLAVERAIGQTAVTAARAACRAIEILHEERQAEAKLAEQRREQQRLDELWRPPES